MEGFLNKKARGEKTIFARHEWSRRWFVLDGQILEYFESFDVSREKPINSKGMMSLEGAIVLPIALAQHKVCFSIQLPGKQELFLEADHESLRKAWMDAIAEACKVNRVARFHTLRAHMPQLLQILGLPPSVEPSLKQLNEALHDRTSTQDAAPDSTELRRVKEAHDRLAQLLLQEQEERKYYWIEFQAEIIKGPPGEGLGVVVAENRHKHYLEVHMDVIVTFSSTDVNNRVRTEVKEVLPCLKLRHLDDAAGGRLLKGDVLVSVNRDRIEHWPLRRVVHRVGDFRAPVGGPLRLGFRRKLLKVGCVPAVAASSVMNAEGQHEGLKMGSASGHNSQGAHRSEEHMQDPRPRDVSEILPPTGQDQHVLLHSDSSRHPLASPIPTTPPVAACSTQGSSGPQHEQHGAPKITEVVLGARVTPDDLSCPAPPTPRILQGQGQLTGCASVTALLEQQSTVERDSQPLQQQDARPSQHMQDCQSPCGTAQDTAHPSCHASEPQQLHNQLMCSKPSPMPEANWTPADPLKSPHPQVFIFSPSQSPVASTAACIDNDQKRPFTTPGTHQSTHQPPPHDTAEQEQGRTSVLDSQPILLDCPGAGAVNGSMPASATMVNAALQSPSSGPDAVQAILSTGCSPSQWTTVHASPQLHEAAMTTLPPQDLQQEAQRSPSLQSAEHQPQEHENPKLATQQLWLPQVPAGQQHSSVLPLTYGNLGPAVQDVLTIPVGRTITSGTLPQHTKLGASAYAVTGASCLPSHTVPETSTITVSRRKVVTQQHDEEAVLQEASQRAPCASSDDCHTPTGSYSTGNLTFASPGLFLPTSLAQIEQQPGSAAASAMLALSTPQSSLQFSAKTEHHYQQLQIQHASAAPQSKDGVAVLSSLSDLPSRDGVVPDWTPSPQVMTVPPTATTTLSRPNLSEWSPSEASGWQGTPNVPLSATLMPSSEPVGREPCTTGTHSGHAVEFDSQLSPSTAQHPPETTRPSTHQHQHQHQHEQQATGMGGDHPYGLVVSTSPQQLDSSEACLPTRGVRTVHFSTVPLPSPTPPSASQHESSVPISPSLHDEARPEKRQHLVPPPLASVKQGPSFWLRGETLPVPPSTHATPHQLMTPTASTLSAVPLWGAAEGVGVKLEHVYPLPLNGTTALDTTQRTVRDDGQDDRCLRALPEIQVATSANPTEVETLRMETRRLTNELKAAAAAINLQEKGLAEVAMLRDECLELRGCVQGMEDESRRLREELLQARASHKAVQAEAQRAITQAQTQFEEKENIVFLDELRSMALASAVAVDATGVIRSQWTKAGSSSAQDKLKRFEKLLYTRGVLQGA